MDFNIPSLRDAGLKLLTCDIQQSGPKLAKERYSHYKTNQHISIGHFTGKKSIGPRVKTKSCHHQREGQ
ncbi:MAG: hypothetical protein IPN72_22680 [Saprospiraceae bacterium]|nr:hypothetical protein [Saprospiraceae bacterium]